MNIANLQLEGLYIAIAATNELMVGKGLLDRAELELALHAAESTAVNDDRGGELTSAQRDAVAFSIRLLRLANQAGGEGEIPSFSALARTVGETKGRYNDQM
jgi:hypothetical protein